MGCQGRAAYAHIHRQSGSRRIRRFSSNGRSLTLGRDDNTVNQWDASTGRLMRAFAAPSSHWAYSFAFSPDGRTIATISQDATQVVKLWDATTGQLFSIIAKEKEPYSSVNHIAFSPDGRILATGGGESKRGSIKLWETATGWLCASCTNMVPILSL